MFAVGVTYLLFERSITSTSTKDTSAPPEADGLSKAILGGQVSLTFLSQHSSD